MRKHFIRMGFYFLISGLVQMSLVSKNVIPGKELVAESVATVFFILGIVEAIYILGEYILWSLNGDN